MADILPFRKPDPHILIVEDDDTTLDVFVEFVQMIITKRVRGMRNAWSAIDYQRWFQKFGQCIKVESSALTKEKHR